MTNATGQPLHKVSLIATIHTHIQKEQSYHIAGKFRDGLKFAIFAIRSNVQTVHFAKCSILNVTKLL